LLGSELHGADTARRELQQQVGGPRSPSSTAAALNYGDCFAYALSRVAGEPLLFKGDDFSQTDVEAIHTEA
jgi:ribonuclease VapC